MLVLSRLFDEEIVIGDPESPLGVVKIVDFRGDKVRLGFEFPPDIPIHRREVAEAIVAERIAARKEKENAGIECDSPVEGTVSEDVCDGVARVARE